MPQPGGELWGTLKAAVVAVADALVVGVGTGHGDPGLRVVGDR